MLRVLATRSSIRCSPQLLASQVRTYGKMDDREKAAEELAIKSHDKELLQKLRQSLGLSEEQQIPDSVVTQVKSINPFASMQKPQATTQTQAPNRNEPITRAEFQDFQIAVLKRLESIENAVHKAK